MGNPSSDSYRNALRHMGQDYSFAPRYLRPRDPRSPTNASPDIKPKEQQGYYPTGSFWTNTTNGNLWALAIISNNLAKWILLASGNNGPILGVNVDANTAPGTDPVIPDPGTGLITITGGQVATGTIGANVIRTDSLAANTFTIEIQRSTAVAATDSTKNGVSHFNSTQFTVDGNGFVSSLSPLNDYHAARYIVSAGGSADGANYTTIATAYAAAVAAGAPQTVFIQPGVYTENLTLVAGINLSSFGSDGYRSLHTATPTVTIIGKLTMTTAGTVVIANIRLQTNSDYLLQVTGTAATIIYLLNCYLNCTNSTGILSSSTSSNIIVSDCGADLTTTGIAYFALSGGGNLLLERGFYNNSGSSLTASTWSNGILTIKDTGFASFLTSSGNGSANIYNTVFNIAAFNTTIIVHNATGTQISIWNCQIFSGTASAITIGAGASLFLADSQILSSNAAIISGAGTLEIAQISYTDSLPNAISVTNQVVDITQKGAYKTALPAGNYTVLATDEIVGATSSAARAITLNASPSTGQVVTIKDITGTANANNITITPAAGNIDGAGTYVINVNYGSITLWYSGVQWFTISKF